MTDEIVQPTDEEIEKYVEAVEEAYLSDDERQTALQAQADLAEGDRVVREQQKRKIKALRRTFKGIHSQRDITILAKIGLMRYKRLHDAELERQRAEQN